MRIVYLHQYFRTPRMSGGTRSFEMARRMVERGHEVHMVTSDNNSKRNNPEGQWWRQSREAGIEVHWLSVPYSNSMDNASRMKSFFRYALESAKRAAAIGPDVVFASSTPLTVALPGIYASRRQRVPLVFEIRDLWPEVPIALEQLNNTVLKISAGMLEWLTYKLSSRIITLSPPMRDGVVHRGADPARVSVIPNGCDLDLFNVSVEKVSEFRAGHNWLGDKPLVVYTGTLGMVNGVGYLVRLASEVMTIDPDIRFLVVGSGREEVTVRSLAQQLGVLNKNFFMMSDLPKSEIPVVVSASSLATSTVIDVPELWKNSANKFFDALSAGRPIAINHQGWQADLIGEHNIGLVLDPHDLQRSARVLVEALADKDWLNAAGERALKLGSERFDRNVLFQQWCDVLENAVKD